MASAIDEFRGSAMLIGGMAVIARGVPRLTRDIDVTIAGSGTDPSEIIGKMNRYGIAAGLDKLIVRVG